MSLLWIAAGAGVLAGTALQAAIGFGFALVAAPLLFAVAGPEQAIGILLALSVLVNAMTLGTERRVPNPLWRATTLICAWAVPGMVAGVAVLRAVDDLVLQGLLTVSVFVALAVNRAAARDAGVPDEPRPLPVWGPPVAGLAAGALATTTQTSGPPLVLLLRGRRIAPSRVRDTLTVSFLAFTFLSAAVLAAADVEGALPESGTLTALAPLVVVGHLAGRTLFSRLARGRYEEVLTTTLVVSAVTGLLAAAL